MLNTLKDKLSNKPMQNNTDFILTYHTQKTKLYTLKNNIITETTPDDNMIGAYQQEHEQIVTPKSKIIT